MEDEMKLDTAPRNWSYEEFAQLPDDGNRYEIIAGRLYVTPSPLSWHQVVVSRLTILLGTFVQKHALGEVLVGPVDVIFGEQDYLAPDLVFVRRDRLGVIARRWIEAAPDLVVEVLSRSTGARDRGIKRERYALFGVAEYWVVDPKKKRIEVHRLADGYDRPAIVTDSMRWQFAPDAPALEIEMAELFRDFGK
jgi:Uma2 family endonuclease